VQLNGLERIAAFRRSNAPPLQCSVAPRSNLRDLPSSRTVREEVKFGAAGRRAEMFDQNWLKRYMLANRPVDDPGPPKETPPPPNRLPHSGRSKTPPPPNRLPHSGRASFAQRPSVQSDAAGPALSGVPMAAVGVDVNRDGRADYAIVGPDLNRDGVPDAMQSGTVCVCGNTFMPDAEFCQKCGRKRPPAGSALQPAPATFQIGMTVRLQGLHEMARYNGAHAVIIKHEQPRGLWEVRVGPSKELFMVRPENMAPVASMPPPGESVPMAAVGVDANRDGRIDYLAVGPDLNRDGIPDSLQRAPPGPPPLPVVPPHSAQGPAAAAVPTVEPPWPLMGQGFYGGPGMFNGAGAYNMWGPGYGEATLKNYVVLCKDDVEVRASPTYADDARVGHFLHPGQVVVIDDRRMINGAWFLHLADGRGWVFETKERLLVMTEVHDFERGLWHYSVSCEDDVETRSAPTYSDDARTGLLLESGDCCAIDERCRVAGTLFLKLADGRGWVFETKDRLLVMCLVEAKPTEARDFARGLWHYTVVCDDDVEIRAAPTYSDEARTGLMIHPGDCVAIDERCRVAAVWFLRLADGRGWVFESKDSRRVMMQLH